MKLTKKSLVTGALIILFTMGVFIAGCAPQQSGSTDGSSDKGATGSGKSDADTPAVVVEWSPTVNCATCHETEESSLTNTKSAAGIHKTEGLECMDCHDDQAGLAKVHEKVEAGQATSKTLKKTKVKTETCTASGCHDNDAERIAATATFTGLTDTNGTTKNPHDLPQGDGHKSLSCSTCHQGHKTFVAEEVIDECYTCHHAQVFECGTCH
ncbi:MAG: hypothetical protein LBG81_05100 [Coriobacteriaceae bacterium]|nr:hypothetical protein [Coriobacteriaceae bacterium]